jgi:hypothetical protein
MRRRRDGQPCSSVARARTHAALHRSASPQPRSRVASASAACGIGIRFAQQLAPGGRPPAARGLAHTKSKPYFVRAPLRASAVGRQAAAMAAVLVKKKTVVKVREAAARSMQERGLVSALCVSLAALLLLRADCCSVSSPLTLLSSARFASSRRWQRRRSPSTAASRCVREARRRRHAAVKGGLEGAELPQGGLLIWGSLVEPPLLDRRVTPPSALGRPQLAPRRRFSAVREPRSLRPAVQP